MLKITREHYALLETACRAVLAEKPDARAQYARAGLSQMRFRWDVLYASKINGARGVLWISDTLYSYLNDDHIDSALRRIVGEN